MFALALWDGPRERLVLARDRFGKKPLLWTRLPDGTLAFASELKALLRLPELSRDVDLAAVDAYLALQYVPGDGTALRGIKKVPPGHVLVVERRHGACRALLAARARRSELERRRVAGARAHHRRRSGAQTARRRCPAGCAAVRRHRLERRGGLDGTGVDGTGADVHGGFSDARYDERTYARAVAERYGTVHEELAIAEDVAGTLPRLAAAYDEPLGDEAALPTFLIAEQARRHVTVALAGDGGDEAFAGYERYIAHGLANRVPGAAARTAAAAMRLLPSARREPRSTAFRAARLLDVAAAPPRGAVRPADGGLPAPHAARAVARSAPRGTRVARNRDATDLQDSSCSM